MANLSAISLLAGVDGVLLVDKPEGLSAHDAERAVKTHFNLAKTGHGATLDPGASGVFAILLGEGTKLAQDLLGADGVYTGTIRLGRETDTCDARGRTCAEREVPALTPERLAAAAADFRGDIFQTPPAFSAIRFAGRATWEIVPSGKDAAGRLVHVYRLTLGAYTSPVVDFSVVCTKGFSARALARDFGAALGCGGHLETLRRTRTGKFEVADALPLMDILKLDAVGLKNRVIPVCEAARR